MKKHLLFFCILSSLYCSSQTSLGKVTSNMVEVYDASGRPLTGKGKEIKGSPLLSDNWGTGTVKFANGRLLKNVLLRFNLYSNELYYKLDEIEIAFVDLLKEFSLSYEEEGKTFSVLFRTGYPGSKPFSEKLFYQVLVDGPRFQLVKRNYKSIQEYYDYSSAASKIFRPASELYIYDAQLQSLTLVKNKEPLARTVPQLAEAISHISSNQDGKFKTEKELVDIFTKLNP